VRGTRTAGERKSSPATIQFVEDIFRFVLATQSIASSMHYQPAADRNAALRERIVQLAQRHRRYGAGMIYLQLRQAGHCVNQKRVDRSSGEDPS
jgi:hypothetical protein